MSLHAFRKSLATACCLGSALSGCGTDPTAGFVAVQPTAIEVNPQAFLGTLPCNQQPGAVRSYVATLTDLTPGASLPEEQPGLMEPFTLPSSEPVDCLRSVYFGFVAAGHAYRTEIQAYDRDDLEPLRRGLPILVDPSNGEPVAPRWTAQCQGVEVASQIIRTLTVEDCALLSTTGPETPTRVRVALDPEACESESTVIDRVAVRYQGEVVATGPCGESLELEDFPQGETAQLELLAFEAEADSPSLGAPCSVRALPGITVDALCEPLRAHGAVVVDLGSTLDALNLRCGPAIEELWLELVDSDSEPLRFFQGECQGSARYSDLAPGEYTVRASVAVRGDARPRVVECTASVEPGFSAAALCTEAE